MRSSNDQLMEVEVGLMFLEVLSMFRHRGTDISGVSVPAMQFSSARSPALEHGNKYPGILSKLMEDTATFTV